MIRTAISLGLILGLAGCAQYTWVHDARPAQQADTDLLGCEEKAVGLYPTTVATDISGGGSDGSSTACGSGNQTAGCVTKTGKVRDTRSYSRDINSNERRSYISRCMRAEGWRQVEVKD